MEVTADKVQYINFEDLTNPEIDAISEACIQIGFQSKQWTVQFRTITKLRQANRHLSVTFLNEVLPRFYKQIVQQVDNLRSNNSKEALTLLTEIFTHQTLEKVSGQIIKPIVAILFLKSVCEKGFLKSEAMKAINRIPYCWNASILDELMNQTKSNNGSISELAIKIINQMLQKNAYEQIDEKFLKDLSFNINGKRSVVQKNAKQILATLKKRMGQQKLENLIDQCSQLDADQSNTLKRQLKYQIPIAAKSGGSFRQFMKKKKDQLNASN